MNLVAAVLDRADHWESSLQLLPVPPVVICCFDCFGLIVGGVCRFV